MTTDAVLEISGAVAVPVSLAHTDLAAFPDQARIDDVSQVDARRRGQAVRLEALLAQVCIDTLATHITLHSSTDDFAVSLPLESARDVGILIYGIDGAPLDQQEGGPFRFLIPDAAACRTAELDACANVKFLDRIELTTGRGRDTRSIPETGTSDSPTEDHTPDSD